MANGKVLTGFSLPYVAKYTCTDGTVTYSDGQPLARGVSAELKINSSDGSNFYGDNSLAETSKGKFTSGTVTLIVDGLKKDARRLIYGLPDDETLTVESKEVKITPYDDSQEQPYVGIGFVARYQEEGVESYTAYILTKSLFSPEPLSAATQEQDISFQTTSLEATLTRDGSAKHTWRKMAEDLTTEAEAYAVIKAILTPKVA